MFGQYTYLLYTLLFTLPLIGLLWWRHFQQLWRDRTVILLATGLAVLYALPVWPKGLAWGCWAYDDSKILGITIFGAILEDLVWWACITLLMASFVMVAARCEERGSSIIAGILGIEAWKHRLP